MQALRLLNQAATIRDEMAAGRQRAALVAPHQAGVADNVCGQDRRQFSLLTGQWNFPAFLPADRRRPGPARQ